MSQNAARHSVDSSMLAGEMSIEQQQQQQHDEAVKHTVGRVLSRLGLSQLISLIDMTVINQPDTDSIQVRVIRSTQSRVDELHQVGNSFALLLQLLRRCTNWNELVIADTSLSDALTRLTEHEFTGGTMGYGVHTEKAVEHLASMLTATSSDSCQQQSVPNMPKHISVLSQWIDVQVDHITIIQDEVCAGFDDEDKAVSGQLKYSETRSVDVDIQSVQETSSVDVDARLLEKETTAETSSVDDVDARLLKETTDSATAKTDDRATSQSSAHELHLTSDAATSLSSHSHDVHKHCQSDVQACDSDVSQSFLVENYHDSDTESPVNGDSAAPQYNHGDH